MSAYFELSESKAIEQYKKIEDITDIVSYSNKTNPEVTKILEKNTNCLFSVHSVNELKGISDKSRVLFLAQAWDQKLIKELTDMKIGSFVVDNKPDLDELLNFLDNTDIKINLLLRVKLKENTIRTEKYYVFGMSAETVNNRLKELKNNDKISKLGIHFHRKTQNMSEWDLKYEISEIVDDFTLIDFVDIGGGIPSVYANTNEDVIRVVFNKIKEFKTWLNEKNIQMIVEPGRFIAAPAVKLITNIKSIYDNNIIVDASVYNTDMDALIVPVKLLVEGESDKGTPYVIKGETPCSLDLFRYKVYLDKPKIGDRLIFLNAGAYNFNTSFCNLDKLETRVVD